MLRAYFDESGHLQDRKCRFVGMGGLVAPADNWERFDKKWKAALDTFIDGRPFHMKDYVRSKDPKPPYVGWDTSKRTAFMSALLDAIEESAAQLVGCVVSIDGFSALMPEHQIMFRGPYFIAFQKVTRGASICGLSLDGPDRGEKVAMVYAYQKEYGAIESGSDNPQNQGQAEQLWHAMRQSGTIDTNCMGAYSSAFADDVFGLQAADLLAYELTREFENSLQHPDLAMRKSLQRLLAKDYKQGLFKFYSFEALLETLIDSGLIAENKDVRWLRPCFNWM